MNWRGRTVRQGEPIPGLPGFTWPVTGTITSVFGEPRPALPALPVAVSPQVTKAVVYGVSVVLLVLAFSTLVRRR